MSEATYTIMMEDENTGEVTNPTVTGEELAATPGLAIREDDARSIYGRSTTLPPVISLRALTSGSRRLRSLSGRHHKSIGIKHKRPLTRTSGRNNCCRRWVWRNNFSEHLTKEPNHEVSKL